MAKRKKNRLDGVNWILTLLVIILTVLLNGFIPVMANQQQLSLPCLTGNDSISLADKLSSAAEIKAVQMKFTNVLMPSLWDGSQAEGQSIVPRLTPVSTVELLQRQRGYPERSYLGECGKFWATVQVSLDFTQCWLWRGAVMAGGYGQCWWLKTTAYTHRVAYKITLGPIPKGLNICHKCDVKRCCNPNHLFLGTQQDNIDDACAKGRMVIVRGERNGSAILTATQVLYIRASPLSAPKIAKHFGVSKWTIASIRRGQNWRHI